MNLPSQIEEKEKTLTELMARILNEPLRPVTESLQQTITEIKGVKATLKGLSENVDDSCQEIENGNDALRELKMLLTGLRNQDMVVMKNGLAEIQTAHNKVEAELKALATRLNGTEERLNDLTGVAQQGQERLREQYRALQAQHQINSQTMADALARHATHCETANETTLAALNQSATAQINHLNTLQSTVEYTVDETRQLKQHALEEHKKNGEDLTRLSEKNAVLEARLAEIQQSLHSLTRFMYVTLSLVAALIGHQLWTLIQA